MKTIDELEGRVELDSAGYPDLEFEKFDKSGDKVAPELDLLAAITPSATR